MTHRILLFETESPSDPVAQELAKLYHLEVLDTTKDDQIQGPGWISRIAGLVLDCSGKGAADLAADKAALEAALANDAPVVLLNVTDGEYMAGLCGIGFETGCAVVRPYGDGSTVIDILDPNVAEAQSATIERSGTQDAEGTLQLITKDQRRVRADRATLPTAHPFAELPPEERADAIEEILEAEPAFPEIDGQREIVGASSASLPPGQTWETKVNINYSAVIQGRQTFNNAVRIDVSLIASYDAPAYKYLEMTSMGAGFSPANGGDINKDGKSKRRYFQEVINLHMTPSGTALTIDQHSPMNINGSTLVTTSSSYTVGVDVSKNPSFNASYTVGESVTREIRDFDIINRVAGRNGSWDYQLGMSASSIWDLFREPFGKKAQVKSLPNLAKYNLTPTVMMVWYTDNTFNNVVRVEIGWDVDYYNAWVTGDWASYKMKVEWWTYWAWQNCYVDFSKVNPEGGS